MASYDSEYDTLRSTFASQRTKSIKWRKWQLKQFWWMMEDNEQRWLDALTTDLGRHPFESATFEIQSYKRDVLRALENVEKWAAGSAPDGAGLFFGKIGQAWLRKEPLGVALIIGAFNFPLATLVNPAIGAVAAGNCVVLKPSELCKATQDLLIELAPKYLDNSAIKVITGGADEVGKLLGYKWDTIFYTGGSKVARIIASAAAKNLTPVTLELGGQDPVIVGKSANVDLAAKRIANAKFVNAGQVCVNANHIFADPAIHDQLVERLIYWNKEFTKTDGSLASIVNERHFDRISNLLKGTKGDVVYSGTSDRTKRYIHPTVVKNVQLNDSLMSEELFGPIAPVLSSTVDDAISVVNSMPHALALYIFSNDKAEIDKILDATNSGGVTINDVMIHVAVPGAPFGGVGESGNGAQGGKYTFDAFSHTRTVLSMPGWMEKVLSFRYPPFDLSKMGMAKVKGGSLIGKRGQTMEEQTVGGGFSATGVIGKALLVTAVLVGLDRASGGRMLITKTLGDVLQRVRR